MTSGSPWGKNASDVKAFGFCKGEADSRFRPSFSRSLTDALAAGPSLFFVRQWAHPSASS